MENLNPIIIRQLKKNGISTDVEMMQDTDNKDIPVVYFYDELDYFSDQCIFDGCTQEEIILLLQSFCTESYIKNYSWQVCCELSKLLAKYGKLIAKEVEDFIFHDKASNFTNASLHLSYFATDEKWEEWCLKCLDLCNEDFRDGIFLACYRLDTLNIYLSLVKHFTEWMKRDSDWGNGTGELQALGKFLDRWNQNPAYRLHSALQTFFNQRV